MRVRFTPRARNDLVSILDYIDERSQQGAHNVKRAIRSVIELIGQAPESGRLSGVADAHVLPAGRYPYLIYWAIVEGEVWILHIRHAARQPWRGD